MSSSIQTFLAVIVGAVVAALGGFAATQLGIWIDHVRRARDAALLSGEVLAAVGALLRLAGEAALDGTFLDPLPASHLSFARREIAVYDRNRELLFSLADPTLRVRLHAFMIRLSIPLDRLADSQARYAHLRSISPLPEQAGELLTQMTSNFSYLMESRKLIPELLSSLQPLARTKFDAYGRIDHHGTLGN